MTSARRANGKAVALASGVSPRKVLVRVMSGHHDASVRFLDLLRLLRALGFAERTRASHHTFGKPGVVDIINLQAHGSTAKPYQVRQVRQAVIRYNLTLEG